jgi:hypothetical protein
MKRDDSLKTQLGTQSIGTGIHTAVHLGFPRSLLAPAPVVRNCRSLRSHSRAHRVSLPLTLIVCSPPPAKRSTPPHRARSSPPESPASAPRCRMRLLARFPIKPGNIGSRVISSADRQTYRQTEVVNRTPLMMCRLSQHAAPRKGDFLHSRERRLHGPPLVRLVEHSHGKAAGCRESVHIMMSQPPTCATRRRDVVATHRAHPHVLLA